MIIYESFDKQDIQKLFSEVYNEFTDFSDDLGFCIDAIVNPDIEWTRTNATRKLGDCHRVGYKYCGGREIPVFQIRLNPAILEFDSSYEDNIKAIIAHELCHTLPGCFNHGKEFQTKGKLIQDLLGYYVNTKADEETSKYFNNALLAKPAYKVICDNCGAESDYTKLDDKLKKSWQYKCSSCGKPYLVTYKLNKKTGEYKELEDREFIDAFRKMMNIPLL